MLDDRRYRVRVWRTPLSRATLAFDCGVQTIDFDAGAGPTSDLWLAYGLDVPVAAWLPARRPARIGLVVNRDEPCRLLDRIREASDEGRHPIAIIFSRADLKASLPVPGTLLGDWLGTDAR